MEITREQALDINRRVLELIRRRKYHEAAALVDTIAGAAANPADPNIHPSNYVELHWGGCEILGDYEKRTNPQRAVRMYRIALATAIVVASSATGSGEGLMYQERVEKLRKKIDRMEHPRKPWWKFWADRAVPSAQDKE